MPNYKLAVIILNTMGSVGFVSYSQLNFQHSIDRQTKRCMFREINMQTHKQAQKWHLTAPRGFN